MLSAPTYRSTTSARYITKVLNPTSSKNLNIRTIKLHLPINTRVSSQILKVHLIKPKVSPPRCAIS